MEHQFKLKFVALSLKIKNFFERLKTRVKENVLNTDGMGTIEVIIIIAVLVALALLFRYFIMNLADGVFDTIQDKTDEAISGL